MGKGWAGDVKAHPGPGEGKRRSLLCPAAAAYIAAEFNFFVVITHS